MGWLVLGLVLGLIVGAAVVAAILRSVGRITGTGGREVVRLVVDGLVPGRRRDGVAAQRALARHLQRAGARTASGRRVAADEVVVQVSPEDEEAIASVLGIETAERDLAEFYRERASRGGWIIGEEPQVRIVKDISLRPRQVVVRTVTRPRTPPPAAPAPVQAPSVRPAVGTPSAGTEDPLPVAVRRAQRPTPPPDDAITDVLPRELLEEAGPSHTAVYPVGMAVGDLVVVHGTDVRTVAAAAGSIRIGRGPHNDLVIARPGVGRDHLLVEVRGDAWWIVPGTSQGGTTLDGVPLDGPAELSGPATLGLGRGVRIRLSVEEVSAG
ncbi:FhaA domain-containing protein [uncultured Amnibacterium sp.]|uniref:FhaA domain-containing protein n=1 Tax=uncultured Amnibacterium sp. TaxID=1631851 RepID=UPI0035CA67CF